MSAHFPPPFSAKQLLLQWTLDPVPLAAIVLVAALYFGGLRRLRSGPRFPAGRPVAFYSGLLVVAVALFSAVDVYADVSLTAHMVQHVLLMFVAAPLLALGAPVTLLLRASSARTRKRFVLPLLHSRAVAVLSHPVTAWLVFAAVQYATHFTGLYEAALESETVHAVEHALYLGAALLFWWPIVGLDPAPRRLSHPARLLYLVLAMPLEAFLGVAILSADTVLYPHYAGLPAPWGGEAALQDQVNGGSLMWITGDLVALVAGLLIAAAWFRHDEARQRRLEAEMDGEAGFAAGGAMRPAG